MVTDDMLLVGNATNGCRNRVSRRQWTCSGVSHFQDVPPLGCERLRGTKHDGAVACDGDGVGDDSEELVERIGRRTSYRRWGVNERASAESGLDDGDSPWTVGMVM
jgi:hypothetical protein